MIASKAFYRHDFPAPHTDSVESVIDYRVPPDKFTALAEFDGSVIAERTASAALPAPRLHCKEWWLSLEGGFGGRGLLALMITASVTTPSIRPRMFCNGQR